MTNKDFVLKILKYLFILIAWLFTMLMAGIIGGFIGREELKQEIKRTHNIEINY